MSRYYQIATYIIAGLVIVFLVGDIISRLAGAGGSEPVGPEKDMQPTAEAGPVPIETANDYQVIVDRNIFAVKKGLVIEEPVVSEIDTLEQTSLRIRLMGTIAGNLQNGRAIILDEEKGKQNIYRVGDAVQGGEIKMILREKVVIQVAGRDEVLEMAEKGKAAKTRSASVRLASSLNKQPVTLPSGGPDLSRLPPGSGSPPPGSSSLTVDRAELQKLSPSTDYILKQAGFVPYLKKGKTEGLIINQIKANSIFYKLKLSNGDIIQKINGRDIKSPEDLEVITESLESESKISIQMTRRGRLKIVNYNLR